MKFFKMLLIISLTLVPHSAREGVQTLSWGFYVHKLINRLAVFSLPDELYGFYRRNIRSLTLMAIVPDQRRYALPGEGARHFIDMDAYAPQFLESLALKPDTLGTLPDSLQDLHGILPFQVHLHRKALTRAMFRKNRERILQLSAEIAHYISDAHVPLHTTSNYDGQQTGQRGIHSLWESRLPELFAEQYDLFVRKAFYRADAHTILWESICEANSAVDSVLRFEKELSERRRSQKAHERRNNAYVLQFSSEYAAAYSKMLNGMVARQLRRSIRMTADYWYTCWVDAGQPDLNQMDSIKMPDSLFFPAQDSTDHFRRPFVRKDQGNSG